MLFNVCNFITFIILSGHVSWAMIILPIPLLSGFRCNNRDVIRNSKVQKISSKVTKGFYKKIFPTQTFSKRSFLIKLSQNVFTAFTMKTASSPSSKCYLTLSITTVFLPITHHLKPPTPFFSLPPLP